MKAVLPSVWIEAPRRFISCTCMKRFSKMVSVTRLGPEAIVFTAMNWACMSVGKPGYSVVRKDTGFGRPSMRARMVLPDTVSCTPISRSLSRATSKMSVRVLVSTISPPVAATAHRKVAASMRSEITACSAPCSSATPWITRRSVPMPSIFAPMATRRLARSVTSGSRAAFSSTVSPWARVAAIRRFSVPVTVIMSVWMRAPCSLLGALA